GSELKLISFFGDVDPNQPLPTTLANGVDTREFSSRFQSVARDLVKSMHDSLEQRDHSHRPTTFTTEETVRILVEVGPTDYSKRIGKLIADRWNGVIASLAPERPSHLK